jgi:hypothetical protein
MYALSPVRRWSGRAAAALLVAAMIAGAAWSRLAPCASDPAASAVPAAVPTAVVLVELRDPSFDLAHFIFADRPDGFAARVTPLRDRPCGVAGDLRRWRRLEVAMDDVAAFALAWRLSTLPPIASARLARR